MLLQAVLEGIVDWVTSDPTRFRSHLDRIPPDAGLFGLCGDSFLSRFRITGDDRDIVGAAEAYEQAAVCLSNNAPDMQNISGSNRHQRVRADLPIRFSSLAGLYFNRFENAGDMHDITEAIRHQKRAIELIPDGQADLPHFLNDLGISFVRRFQRTGEMQDISQAILHLQRAVQLTPDETTLENLGTSFSCRFDHTGDMQDISEAIQHKQRAIQLTPDEHVSLPVHFGNLGTSFMKRFVHSGDVQDLLDGIHHLKRSVLLTPEGDPNLPGWLSNLGIALRYHFINTGDMQELSEAIRHQRRAIQLTPDGHPDLPAQLSNISTSLRKNFERTGNLEDLSEAIRQDERAVQLIPVGHPFLPVMLSNLGNLFSKHFEHTRNIQDILEAIRHQQRAVQLTPEGYAQLPLRLNCLGVSFSRHFQLTGGVESHSSAISNFRISATSSAGSLSLRLDAAKLWAIISPPSELLEAHSTIIQLLSLISGFENTVQRRHETLLNTSDLSLAASAAALDLGRPDKAVEWLVEGRCIVWNQINHLRTPIDELRSYDSALAERLSNLSRELDMAGLRDDFRLRQAELTMNDKISLEDDARAHLNHARDWEQLLNEIRNIHRFEDFLRPKKCADIMSSLPEEGPIVIINVHHDRCDALALMAGAIEPQHIPLPHFSYKEAERLANGLQGYLVSLGVRLGHPLQPCDSPLSDVGFSFVLKLLWSNVVSPILKALEFSVPESGVKLPRIWWCPTGLLAFLPIHAAGIYEWGKGVPGQCLSEFAVSSYIPMVNFHNTFNSIHDVSAPAGLLMVTQPNTPGKAKIPFARSEVEKIEKQLEMRGIPSCTLGDENASVSRVLDSMDEFPCIHLACHASQHALMPLKSSIHLHDGPLELSEIMKKNLRNADFAFLSACQTSKGDENISEEVVHLASGMLAAGYRSVVGTMWSVSDQHCPDIAELFYQNLLEDKPELDGSRAARALHATTQQLQEKVSDYPYPFLAWVPYIHIGI